MVIPYEIKCLYIRILALPGCTETVEAGRPDRLTLQAITDSMYGVFTEPLYAAPPLLRRMTAAGLLGRKIGRGFPQEALALPARSWMLHNPESYGGEGAGARRRVHHRGVVRTCAASSVIPRLTSSAPRRSCCRARKSLSGIPALRCIAVQIVGSAVKMIELSSKIMK
jgi:hypothetical protein